MNDFFKFYSGSLSGTIIVIIIIIFLLEKNVNKKLTAHYWAV